jgi:malate/lactate dehydrogenase
MPYALMIKGTAREITLVDYDYKKAEAKLWIYRQAHRIQILSTLLPALIKIITGSDLVVITAGKNRNRVKQE